MPKETYAHSNYLEAFQQFLHAGDGAQLSEYLEGERPAAFLSVYRNGFIRASAAALESNFPCLVKLWGEDYFAQVAKAYIDVSPPASATLIGYGFESAWDTSNLCFTDFLQQKAAEIIQQFPYVLDICQLEQAWSLALNEAGDDFLTLEAVQELIASGVDLSELPLALVDSSKIVQLEFDIFELWGQLRFGELSDAQATELERQDNTVIFWQRDLQVQAKPLSSVEAVFMDHLKQGRSFDEANEAAVSFDEAFDISTLFAELLTAHLIKQETES